MFVVVVPSVEHGEPPYRRPSGPGKAVAITSRPSVDSAILMISSLARTPECPTALIRNEKVSQRPNHALYLHLQRVPEASPRGATPVARPASSQHDAPGYTRKFSGRESLNRGRRRFDPGRAHHMKNSEILPTSGLLIGDPCGWTVTGCWRPSPYRPRGFHIQRLLDEVCAS